MIYYPKHSLICYCFPKYSLIYYQLCYFKPKYIWDILPKLLFYLQKYILIYYLFNCFKTKVYVVILLIRSFLNQSIFLSIL
ncbi:hypothetical protein Hanom_Chr10g00918681 [Helianthus anomalus]